MSTFQEVLENLKDGDVFESQMESGKHMVTMNESYFKDICGTLDKYELIIEDLSAELSTAYAKINQAEEDYDIEVYEPDADGRISQEDIEEFKRQHEDIYGKQTTSH